MLPKFFYVITRDNQIFELKYDANLLTTIAKTMTEKGLITLKDYGMILNGVDISKVLNDEQYENYISSTKPKEYIRNGVWRDGKENGVIRYAKWKQLEIDNKKQLSAPTQNISDEEREIISKKGRDFLESIRPNKKI